MNIKGIEIFRAIIPANKLINDNSGQHYRIMAGKGKWLTNLATNAIDGIIELPDNFKIPSVEKVNEIINPNRFTLILEHWKCQRSFDLANYEMTFKHIIDVFSKRGYWKDDAWKYLNPLIFAGGDHSNWSKATKGTLSNLSDDIRKEWWLNNNANPTSDSLIRIIACPNIDINVILE